METVIIDGNNVFISLAQGLWADPKAKHAVVDLVSVRKMVLTYIGRQLGLGNTVILCIDFKTWRKRVFREYKARRAEEKEKSGFPYDQFIEVLQAVCDEIKTVPGRVKVMQVEYAEGDDLIAVMAALNQPCVIHSTDKDLLQLQTFYDGVRQFSPRDWEYITPESKSYDLVEHIIRGDPGDGIPNILSADDVFVTRTRQTVLTKTRYQALYEMMCTPDPEMFCQDDPELLQRYRRNKQMVDLREIPDDIVSSIIHAYESIGEGKAGEFSNLLMKHGITI